MKVYNKIFRFVIKILVCISIANAKNTEIIQPIMDAKSNSLLPILNSRDGTLKLDFLEENVENKNPLRIKQRVKRNLNIDDFSNEDFSDQDNIILSLKNFKELKEPPPTTRIQRQREMNSYELLENVSENENADSDEVQEVIQNLKSTPKPTYIQYVVSNLPENFNVAEDVSRMISVIGSLEDTVEDSTDNFLFGKTDKGKSRIFSKNRNYKNEMELNRILSKVNRKLNKDVTPPSDNETAFINRIEMNVAVDESQMKNVQTLKITRQTKKVINPHLGEKKSFFKYKQALIKASNTLLNETTSKKSSKKASENKFSK